MSSSAASPLRPPTGWGAKSDVSAGTSERGVKPFPPDGASSRPPRNCTESAMISID
jgi:hypothetical protein